MHMKTPLPDYHMHTARCNHAVGAMEDYVLRAIERGIGEIGFSDHMPVMPEPHLAMTFDELPGYVEEVLSLAERYRGDITIRLGCEMDIVPDRFDDIRGILSAWPFDYVIGSIHYLDGWPFDQEQYRDVFFEGDPDAIYARFFNAVIGAAETGVFDIVGHVDNIKCMGFWPDEELTPLYERVADVLAARDVTVELNTSGIDKPCGEQYPSAAFLEILAGRGVAVTTGSDAHDPGHVGRYFDRAERLLAKTGIERIARFERRTRTFSPLHSGERDTSASPSTDSCE